MSLILLFVDFLCLFFFLNELFFFFLKLPNLIFLFLLFLQKLILGLIVISEKKHLPIDQRLEGMGLKAHINQED